MGYSVQDQNQNATVKVNPGTFSQTGEPQTDFIISEVGFPNDHRHIVVNQLGDVVYDQINPNR